MTWPARHPSLAALLALVLLAASAGAGRRRDRRNDVRAYDPARFAADSAALTRALPAGSYVADVPYFMHGRWESNADEAARVISDDARDNGLRVVPLHDALRAEGWQAMFTQFAADWLHLNDRGHRVWAGAFWDAIAAEEVPAVSPSSVRQLTSPRRKPSATACARSLTPSLRYSRRACVLMVSSDR
ncbi:MAG: SGNH/GDSL hydrolase family protein [Mycobacteriales bacterium]